MTFKPTRSQKPTFIYFNLILERCLFNHGSHWLMPDSPLFISKVHDLTHYNIHTAISSLILGLMEPWSSVPYSSMCYA